MANPYLSASAFYARHDVRTFRGLSGDKGAPQGDDANVQAILDSCASMIDSYLAGRVPLPLAAPPGLLTDLTADLAAYRLFGRRSDSPKTVKQAYDDALAWLKDFGKGLVQLPGVTRAALPAITQRDRVSRFDYAFGSQPARPPRADTSLNPDGIG